MNITTALEWASNAYGRRRPRGLFICGYLPSFFWNITTTFYGTYLDCSDTQRQEVRVMTAVPVSLSIIPPPPPQIPPPPPPAPASGLTRVDSSRKSTLRKLNWERIPRERVEGRRSVWSGSLDEDEDLPIDLNSLDELFGQKEGRKLDRANNFRQSLLRCGSPPENSVDKVRYLPQKWNAHKQNIMGFLPPQKNHINTIIFFVDFTAWLQTQHECWNISTAIENVGFWFCFRPLASKHNPPKKHMS